MHTRMAINSTSPTPADIFSLMASFGRPGGGGFWSFTDSWVIATILLPVGYATPKKTA